MTRKVHKIIWSKEWNKFNKDLEFTVVDIDCMVESVSHPCAQWAVGEYWFRVSKWFENRHAKIILDETDNSPNNTVDNYVN